MISFDPPDLDELQAKHGEDLRVVEDGDRLFVVARPEKPRVHVQRFTELGGNDKRKLEAFEGLARACCVYPDKDMLKRILDEEPGLAFELGNAAGELLGIRQLSVKKG